MPQILKIGGKISVENWTVFHPDGTPMFVCGESRARWYLDRDLAKEIGFRKIKLTFKPKGKGFDRDETFGLAPRKIRCVVTGEKDGLQRHHVVPYCYRQHFPLEYKSKNHHDVLLVTYKIHEEYENLATEFKNKLAEEYNVPSLNDLNLKYTKLISDFSHGRVKTLSRFHSLFRSHNKIPQEAVIETLKMVSLESKISMKKLLGYNYIQLYKLYIKMSETYNEEFELFKEKNRLKYDHGYHLVKMLDTHDKKEEFVKRWRQHFIDTMNPKYMPIGWSVDFRCRVEL